MRMMLKGSATACGGSGWYLFLAMLQQQAELGGRGLMPFHALADHDDTLLRHSARVCN